jgi:hypothetical protein
VGVYKGIIFTHPLHPLHGKAGVRFQRSLDELPKPTAGTVLNLLFPIGSGTIKTE